MRLSLLDALNHLCQRFTVYQFDADAAREPPRLFGVASGRHEEPSRRLTTNNNASEFAHGLHADGLLFPLLALNDEFLAVLAQRQINTTVGAINGVLDYEVTSPPKRFANDRLELPPRERSKVIESALSIELSRDEKGAQGTAGRGK